MKSDDLARPVVFVKRFPEEKVLYEIYSYGESVVVMPRDDITTATKEKPQLYRFAQYYLEEILSQELRDRVTVEAT
jgi:ATPase